VLSETGSLADAGAGRAGQSRSWNDSPPRAPRGQSARPSARRLIHGFPPRQRDGSCEARLVRGSLVATERPGSPKLVDDPRDDSLDTESCERYAPFLHEHVTRDLCRESASVTRCHPKTAPLSNSRTFRRRISLAPSRLAATIRISPQGDRSASHAAAQSTRAAADGLRKVFFILQSFIRRRLNVSGRWRRLGQVRFLSPFTPVRRSGEQGPLKPS
jgi:hypothetical protein